MEWAARLARLERTKAETVVTSSAAQKEAEERALVGAAVVKTMSKYRARMDVDTFKKHAKEVL